MKVSYKGYEIEVNRDKCLGGYEMIYYSIFRESDGLEVVSDFTESDTVWKVVAKMRMRVLTFIETKGESEGLQESYVEDETLTQTIEVGGS